MSSTMTLQPSAARVKQSCLPRLRAPPVTSATLPLIPRSMPTPYPLASDGGALSGCSPRTRGAQPPAVLQLALPPLKLRRALLEEGLDALARVLGADHLLEGAHLDLDGLVDGRLDA